jgi:hypothetical protein
MILALIPIETYEVGGNFADVYFEMGHCFCEASAWLNSSTSLSTSTFTGTISLHRQAFEPANAKDSSILPFAAFARTLAMQYGALSGSQVLRHL